MRIAAARITPIRLALKAPLATSRGPVEGRLGAVIELVGNSGARGWGEALPLPGFDLESAAEATAGLERIAAALLGTPRDLGAALDAAARHTGAARSAQAATDFALHDLAALEAGVPAARLLGASPRERVAVGALLGGGDPRSMAAAARRAVARGFRTLKLKLGADDLAGDEARVAAVRDAVGGSVALRLDANGAWKQATACEAVARLAPYAIEMLEQPVPANDIAALGRVRSASPIPIAADEAVRDLASATRLLEAKAVDVIVLKPAAVGGLRAAVEIAARTHQAGAGVVVTSFLDSSLGIAAALALAAALPETRFAAGLATAELLADDLAPRAVIEGGGMQLPAASGLGVSVRPEALRRCAVGPARELRA